MRRSPPGRCSCRPEPPDRSIRPSCNGCSACGSVSNGRPTGTTPARSPGSPRNRAGASGVRRRWETALAFAATTAVPANSDEQNKVTHTEVQGWLRDLGLALGFQVWIAANDHNRPLNGGRLGECCLDCLPESVMSSPGAGAIALIDVIWLAAGEIAAAFEVEHTTSIYSGIVRLLDLALGAGAAARHLYLVAPDGRERDVRAQLERPAVVRRRVTRRPKHSQCQRRGRCLAGPSVGGRERHRT